MLQRLAPALVWFFYGFTSLYGFPIDVNATSTKDCYQKTCLGTEHDIFKAECCNNRLYPRAGFLDCGNQTFHPAAATCCKMVHGQTEKAVVTQGLSEKVSSCCGLKAYNSLNEICCGSTVIAKVAPQAKCCGKETFDAETQLCCGPAHNKTILKRKSRDHICCGQSQYDRNKECCCDTDVALEIKPMNSSCCEDKSVLHCGPAHNKTILKRKSRDHICCGQSQYDIKNECCCDTDVALEIQPICSSCCRNKSGRYNAAPTVYNPDTHVRWDGCVSAWKPRIDQCHDPPKQHQCGTEVYQPLEEICCDGHRHPKMQNMNCCGVHAYNIKNQHMKCCAGTLYNLTLTTMLQEAQCCGSILQNTQDVCCSCEDNEVLYSAKVGFRCCGHLYYNTSLWSCCAGKLSPVHQQGHRQPETIKDSGFRSVYNLKVDLCDKMLIGTVESVSLHSIMFSSVLKIHGLNSTLKLLPSHYLLEPPDNCSYPELIPGKTYFFDGENFFTHSNQTSDSILQSLQFIISKCY